MLKLNKLNQLFMSLLFVLMLSACGGVIKLDKGQEAKSITDKNYQFVRVDVSIAENAYTAKTKKTYFKKEAFSKSINNHFRRAGLINSSVDTYLKIYVTKIHVRSQLKAFLSIPGSDKLLADVTVVDTAGNVLEKFSVDSNYSLGGTANALASIRAGFLYRNFGRMSSDLFRGKVEAEEEQ